MAQSAATTVAQYLEELPPERRDRIEEVRKAVLNHLPEGYEEVMQWGMISYVIPLERFPTTYNKLPLAIASLASQKNYIALYLNNVYTDPKMYEWFTDSYKATGKRLDIGKSCVRFRTLNDLPIEVEGQAIAATPVDRFIEQYVEVRAAYEASKQRV